MTPSQLEALIQREAEKYAYGARYLDSTDFYERAYQRGASLLLQPLLEALGALEKYRGISATSNRWATQYSEAAEALQRINELLGGGK